MANLKNIRTDIATIKAEIRRTQKAVPPVDEQIERVRTHLTGLAAEARQRIIENSAYVISANSNPADITPETFVLAANAYGLAVLALGVDNIVMEAAALAQNQDNGALRIPAHERHDKLEELARALYELELAEQAAIGASEQRPDVNAAAILGVPLDVAEESGLLGVEGI